MNHLSTDYYSNTANNPMTYTYPVNVLELGHCYGNRNLFVTLDSCTNIPADTHTVRYGLRESTNQQYYLIGWEVDAQDADNKKFIPAETTFTPVYQETFYKTQTASFHKRFFIPFENHHLRSAHFLLYTSDWDGAIRITSSMLFPAGVTIAESEWKGHRYLVAGFPDGTQGLIWMSSSVQNYQITHTSQGQVRCSITCGWHPTSADHEFALSYAYMPGMPPPLYACLDIHVAAPPLAAFYLQRIHLMLEQTQAAYHRYLQIARVITPDAVINRAYSWAKVNQLRDQQEYRWGVGFSNNPPSDTVVGRDSVWYLAGSVYFAPNWSRRLLEFWLQHGMELNGKFTEYLLASSNPLFKDDYGLNINDNTPLFLIACHHYYAMTGDRAFLQSAYPFLLASADYILSQRDIGEHNPGRLVWCTSTETFVRGLCGWRNCIRDYNLSGAVTEVNVLCRYALEKMAELAKAMGDQAGQHRFQSAAEELRWEIEEHLRSRSAANPFYILNIAPDRERREDMTGDLVFPALYDQADKETGEKILRELFGERFWASCGDGLPGGGIRTVSTVEKNYTPKADADSYGLLGGVWPNLALWAARAAVKAGLPDLALKALRDTFLLTERPDPKSYHVVPGELPEYFNGDDLKQRGQPRSTFLFGIYVWAVIECFLGLIPHPDRLEVNPVLPSGWKWTAISRLPYRGYPLSMIAVEEEKTLYTTLPVSSTWHQVIVPDALQEQFVFETEDEVFWLVVPCQDGYEVLAATDRQAAGKLVERKTRRIVSELIISPGCLVRQRFTLSTIA